MKTISVRAFGPLNTRDSAFDDSVGRIMAGVKNSLGILDPVDVERIESILQKYTGGRTVTNATGVTRSGDAIADGRKAAAVVARNIAHNKAVSNGYRDFWDVKNAELRASITR